VSEKSLEEIQARRVPFNETLTKRAGKTLNGYGVCVLQVQLTEFAPCRAIAHNGQVAIGQYSLWTGF
jgi:hypothetical protein